MSSKQLWRWWQSRHPCVMQDGPLTYSYKWSLKSDIMGKTWEQNSYWTWGKLLKYWQNKKNYLLRILQEYYHSNTNQPQKNVQTLFARASGQRDSKLFHDEDRRGFFFFVNLLNLLNQSIWCIAESAVLDGAILFLAKVHWLNPPKKHGLGPEPKGHVLYGDKRSNIRDGFDNWSVPCRWSGKKQGQTQQLKEVKLRLDSFKQKTTKKKQ